MNQQTRSTPSTAASDVDPLEARALVASGAVLVDVREPGEWRAGHADAAMHVPLGSLATSYGALPHDRRLVVVCRSGNRSAKATRALRAAGFDAVNLAGGMSAWLSAGLPVVDDRGARGAVA